MANTLEYIEDYFTGNLSGEEKSAFERKCETDPSFAEEVAFYISVMSHVREELYIEKKKRFDDLYVQLSSQKKQSIWSKNPRTVKFLRPILAVAACLFLIFYFKDPSPKQLASNYIENDLPKQLSIPMNESQDSLQLGIAMLKRKEYSTAEEVFSSLAKKENFAPEAIKNLGILYLITEEYDKAILQFDSLTSYKELKVNQGLFFKAVTLMKRDKGRDSEEAEAILQEVIDKQLAGSKVAEKWITEF